MAWVTSSSSRWSPPSTLISHTRRSRVKTLRRAFEIDATDVIGECSRDLMLGGDDEAMHS